MAEDVSVLHVVEALGGGLADAVGSFAASTPQFEHHLLHGRRDGIAVDRAIFAQFASASELPPGHVGRIRATRAAVRELRPAIVHSHSSFGGAYARLGLSSRRVPIIYSPHCFAFERSDYPAPVRAAFFVAEGILARNTTGFTGCSAHEIELIHRLSSRPADFVANIARAEAIAGASARPPVHSAPVTVAMVGRLAPQKGMSVFARMAREVVQRTNVRALWIGGGPEKFATELRASGVEITGWVSSQEVAEHLRDVDLYVHTGQWEGFPVGLLEAIALDVPSIVCERPYTAGLPADMIATSATLVSRVTDLVESAEARERLLAVNRDALAGHTSQEQARQLAAVYSRALGVPSLQA